MAFSCGFYNAIDHDRVYSATQFGEMFDGLITDGIYATIGQAFAVTPGTAGLSVLIGTGRAWFNKTWSVNTTAYPIILTASDLLLPRIDAVILEVDTRVSVRNNSLKVITGTPNVNPVAPTLTMSNGLYQYPLAYISVAANQETIKKADIDSRIGRSPTPFVTGIIQSISIDNAWIQWEGQFEEWFANLKTSLSGDIAYNLQVQIQQLKDGKVNISDKATTLQAQTGSDNTKWMTPASTQDFLTYRHATTADIINQSNSNRWLSPDQIPSIASNMPGVAASLNWNFLTITSGTTWTVPSYIKQGQSVIVVCFGAGGGGGGYTGGPDDKNGSGGGGGGGGYIKAKKVIINKTSYSIKLGTGGTGGSAGVNGGNGTSTVFDANSSASITANGGEGGKSYNGANVRMASGGNGGSGGGGGGGFTAIAYNTGGTLIGSDYTKGGIGGNGANSTGGEVNVSNVNEPSAGAGGGGYVGNGGGVQSGGASAISDPTDVTRYALDILFRHAIEMLAISEKPIADCNTLEKIDNIGGGGSAGHDSNVSTHSTGNGGNGGTVPNTSGISGITVHGYPGGGGGGGIGKGGNGGGSKYGTSSGLYASGGGGGGGGGYGNGGNGAGSGTGAATAGGYGAGGGGGANTTTASTWVDASPGAAGGNGIIIVIY